MRSRRLLDVPTLTIRRLREASGLHRSWNVRAWFPVSSSRSSSPVPRGRRSPPAAAPPIWHVYFDLLPISVHFWRLWSLQTLFSLNPSFCVCFASSCCCSLLQLQTPPPKAGDLLRPPMDGTSIPPTGLLPGHGHTTRPMDECHGEVGSVLQGARIREHLIHSVFNCGDERFLIHFSDILSRLHAVPIAVIHMDEVGAVSANETYWWYRNCFLKVAVKYIRTIKPLNGAEYFVLLISWLHWKKLFAMPEFLQFLHTFLAED